MNEAEPTSRASIRKRLLALGAVALLGGAGLYLRARLQIDWSVPSVRQLIVDLGVWGPVMYLVLYAFRWAFLIPSQVMLVVAGLCFGFPEGVLYGALGTIMSGVFVFITTRFLSGNAWRERIPVKAARALEAAGRRGGALLVAIGTGYPVGSMTAVHIGAGLTAMPLSLFVPAVAAGSLVRAGLYTYIGNSLAEEGLLQSWPAFAVLALLCLPFLIPSTRARLSRWLW